MDNTINSFGGQELSLQDMAKLLRNMPDNGEDIVANEDQEKAYTLAEKQKQEKAIKMASILLSGVNKLHDGLISANSISKLCLHLNEFYGKLPKFMDYFGLSTENSNAMKLLIGIYWEYMNLLHELGHSDVSENFLDERLKKLNGFYVNFASALRNVNYYRDWKSLEESVDILIKVTAVEEEEMADVNLEIELVRADDYGKIMDIMASVDELDNKSLSGILDRFAKGEIGLEDMEKKSDMWEMVKAKLTIPERESAN